MKHSFIDEYSKLNSPIHRLDPRVKLLSALAFVLAVVLTPPGGWQAFAAYLVLVTAAVILSRVPPWFVLKRSLMLEPFVLVVAAFIPFFKPGEVAGSYNIWMWQVSVTYPGITLFWSVLAKAWLAIICLTLLTATTPFSHLLLAMEKLKVPRVLVMTLSFMYRYIFILEEEVLRMRQARDSRNFGGKLLWQVRVVGHMAGTLFIRAYERGERVYAAMVSRGFDGEVRTLQQLTLRRTDAISAAAFLALLASIAVLSLRLG
ncbi:MAG: cobalt ECF transporter T component CbiQ [Chloroflexota bacterium]